LKEKLTDKAEKSISFEEQNKLLKGKIEGYERLTERLQYELQKSIEVHEEEISKMKNVTNNIIAKKT
jgi:t-SNARE complex subunit (syntaxin)